MIDTLNHYKIWGQVARRDPHTLYARMRENAPIYRAIGPVTGSTFWFMTRYDDCLTVLKDPRFIKEWRKTLSPEQFAQLPPQNPAAEAIDHHLLNLDPPDHTRLRALVHKAFTPAMIEGLRPRIREIANKLFDSLDADGLQEFDLIERFAFPLPITVIAELLGVPPEERDQFRRWTKAIVFNSNEAEMIPAAMELVMYLHNVFEDRRQHPQDDLITALLTVHEAEDKLNIQELLSMIFLLLVAGHETTVNLIANGTLALLQNPDQLQLLRATPGLMKGAVEEMLRYHGPVENTLTRWVAEDTLYKGHVIQRGDGVFASLMSANRDPDVFPDPDKFDITRDPNRHIAFGNGIHFCLGAPLARLEGLIAIETMLQRLPRLELAVNEDQLEWNEQIIIRGLKALPVRRS